MPDDNTPLFPLTKEIPLTQGKVAIVDAEDYERVSALRWYAHYAKGQWSARSNAKDKKTLLMHRFILSAADGELIDHKDGNPLNNKRSNIRLALGNGNNHNCRIGSNNKTGFKGVSFVQKHRRWLAQIKHNRRVFNLGHFDNPTDAARAYDAAAREKFGEFAWLNFPEDGKQ